MKTLINRLIDLLSAIEFRYSGEKTIKIKDINLLVDYSDRGGRQYNTRSSHEEYMNPLYESILTDWDPKLIIDVGANYGFTGLVFAKRFSSAKIVAVEPSPKLCSFIKRNFENNGVNNYTIVQTICGKEDDHGSRFSLNPYSSQDNRVIGMDGWKSIPVPTKTLGKIIDDSYATGNIFIKIDTQGYEERVFQGAEKYLLAEKNWIIKTEFAPDWLESQGTNPLKLLQYLIRNFHVIEIPCRSRFNRNNLMTLFSKPLTTKESKQFLSYVISLDGNDRGWCDLLIIPKN